MRDPSKFSNLSLKEKRELVYEISAWEDGATELLHSWSRHEILEILCVEIGKERKYTGLTKLKIIENLLKIVSEKKANNYGSTNHIESEPSATTGQRSAKRQKKTDLSNKKPVAQNKLIIIAVDDDLGETLLCKNSACRAKISRGDAFCRRCSCCVCYQYDDNKDPSLWLTCSSEHPFQGESCGKSSHLECALRHEKSGIVKDEKDVGLDGSFYCLSCGKVNDLMECWRKQMIRARDTRRVDILCHRISLSHKLLTGTKHYQKLYKIVDEAIKKLEADVGTFSGLPVKQARGIVNRLSSGPEIQILCSSAIESLDLMLSGTGLKMSSDLEVQVARRLCLSRGLASPCANSDHAVNSRKCISIIAAFNADSMFVESSLVAPGIRFEDVSTSSVNVIISYEDPLVGKISGYTLWHRKVDEVDYQAEPTCTLFEPNARFSLSGLSPATHYIFKVVYFDDNKKLRTFEVQMQTCSNVVPNPMDMKAETSLSPATNCSSLSNPSSVEDESNHNVKSCTNEDAKQKYVYVSTTNKDNSKITFTGGQDCNAMDQRGPQAIPVSLLNEENTMGKINSRPNFVNLEDRHSPEGQHTEVTSPRNGANTPVQSDPELPQSVHSSDAGLPDTPFKAENFKGGMARISRPALSKDLDNGSEEEENQVDGGSVKKRSAERRNEKCTENDEKDFGYYVKVIRWLECDGHIEKSFRQKFLTWYSLRATPEQLRVVKVFVDTLIEDPSSLAGQLVDTFSEIISSKAPPKVPMGLCLRLFH
ncbi:hypothetical protein AG4045_029700 [Apium graveolens]|uniref:Uncharacterized protein n=2 Tax=Apium graveolens TaxID=4045 RepID=A0A6L5B9I6_APIGR|nr:hypothetical protein AG4045_029700 [Apium graveolens]